MKNYPGDKELMPNDGVGGKGIGPGQMASLEAS